MRLAIAICLLPAIALAQPAPKDRKQAGDLVKRAIAKSQAGDHDAAVELYEEAYKLIPQPLLLSNIGSEYQQLGKPIEARTYFCKYLEADPTGPNVSYATAQAKTLYIELSGATSVDDKDVCKPIVKPPPPPPPPAPAKIAPQAPPSQTPVVPPPEEKSSPNALRYAGIGVAVVGGIVFGVGCYYGIQAKSISDEITNHPKDQPWDANIHDREAEGQADENKQIGFMIGGGVAAAAGVVMIVLSGSRHESAVSIAPVATHDTVGFAAAGRF